MTTFKAPVSFADKTAAAKDFIIFWTNDKWSNPNWILAKHPKYDSDYIFGYTFVPQLNKGSQASTASQLKNANSLADFDKNIPADYGIENITTNVSCYNRRNQTIFEATSTDNFFAYGAAYQKFFYLVGLVDPLGCYLNYSYYVPTTRTTYSWRYHFWEFVQATNTDDWHKIAIGELLEGLDQDLDAVEAEEGIEENLEDLNLEEIGEQAPSEAAKLAAQIEGLALRYQLETDGAQWVTVNTANPSHPIISDSVKYLYWEAEENVEEGGEALANNLEEIPEETVVVIVPNKTTTTTTSTTKRGTNGWTITVTSNGRTTTSTGSFQQDSSP